MHILHTTLRLFFLWKHHVTNQWEIKFAITKFAIALIAKARHCTVQEYQSLVNINKLLINIMMIFVPFLALLLILTLYPTLRMLHVLLIVGNHLTVRMFAESVL